MKGRVIRTDQRHLLVYNGTARWYPFTDWMPLDAADEAQGVMGLSAPDSTFRAQFGVQFAESETWQPTSATVFTSTPTVSGNGYDTVDREALPFGGGTRPNWVRFGIKAWSSDGNPAVADISLMIGLRQA